jgi:hypothetical protein
VLRATTACNFSSGTQLLVLGGAKVLHVAEALTLREGTTDQLPRGVRDAGAEGFGVNTCGHGEGGVKV